jgi:hypothetical protein
MPEIRECIAHYLCMLWFFQFCLEQKLDLQVLALWATTGNTYGNIPWYHYLPTAHSKVTVNAPELQAHEYG